MVWRDRGQGHTPIVNLISSQVAYAFFRTLIILNGLHWSVREGIEITSLTYACNANLRHNRINW